MVPANILLTLSALSLLLYATMMLVFRRGWLLTKTQPDGRDFLPVTRISVIIAARNEAANIGACLSSIAEQDYPKELFEVIVADDHSEDDTAAIAATFSGALNLRVIRLSDYDASRTNAYKKEALSRAIIISTGALIVTTDADCIVSKCWLSELAWMYETNSAKAIIAPVSLMPWKGFSGIFQSLDFMTMQGITAAVNHFRFGSMANGANFAFSRDAFEKVDGYEGTTHLASGDDYHLLQKLQRTFPGEIKYFKSSAAIVSTLPQPDWRSFFQQRIRWASKSGKDGDARLAWLLAFVYLFNCLILIDAIVAVFFSGFWLVCLSLIFLKIVVELAFLWPVSLFFNKRNELIIFPFLQPLHIAYIVSAGFFGMIGKYKWKGRSVR